MDDTLNVCRDAAGRKNHGHRQSISSLPLYYSYEARLLFITLSHTNRKQTFKRPLNFL